MGKKRSTNPCAHSANMQHVPEFSQSRLKSTEMTCSERRMRTCWVSLDDLARNYNLTADQLQKIMGPPKKLGTLGGKTWEGYLVSGTDDGFETTKNKPFQCNVCNFSGPDPRDLPEIKISSTRSSSSSGNSCSSSCVFFMGSGRRSAEPEGGRGALDARRR